MDSKGYLIPGLQAWVLGFGLLAAGAPGASAHGVIDHATWDALLRRFVHAGMVDYDGFAAERQALERYLETLREAPLDHLPSDEDQIAFWINAYNAAVIKGVLDHAPIGSVKQVKGFFDRIRYPVGGESLTLNEMEARGRAFGEWRIHAALVCASSSCPLLRAEAYDSERLEAQLTEQTAQFLGDPARGLRVEGSTLWASKIFKWYAKDFVPTRRLSAETLIPVLAPSLDPVQARALQGEALKLKFMDYDWSLNDAAP